LATILNNPEEIDHKAEQLIQAALKTGGHGHPALYRGDFPLVSKIFLQLVLPGRDTV
jgi:hypothetical protein